MNETKELEFYPIGVCPECGNGVLEETNYIWYCNYCEFSTPEGDEE